MDAETETLIASTLTANYGKQIDSSDTSKGPPNLVYQCQGSNVGEMGALRSGNGHLTGGVPFVAHHAEHEGRGGSWRQSDINHSLRGPNGTDNTLIAHTLSANGADASEDGTGRGVPLVFDTTQITSPFDRSNPKPGNPCHTLASGAHPPAIAFSCKDNGQDASDLAPTLRAMEFDGSHANGGGQVAVQKGTIVRRLTPREAERLQGFPDDFTLVPYRGKPASDGPRYRALGNSMATTVVQWIGKRIARVDQIVSK